MAAVERDPRGAKLLLQFSFVSAGWLIDDQVGVGLLEQIDQIGDARLAVVEEVRFFSVDRDVDFIFGDVGSDNDFVVASCFVFAIFISLSFHKEEGKGAGSPHLHSEQCKTSVRSIQPFLPFARASILPLGAAGKPARP